MLGLESTMKIIRIFVLLLLVFYLGGCATTIPVEERAQKREDINRIAEETITALVEKNPELQDKVDASVGYFVAQVSAVSATVIGGGAGIGVLYNKEDSTRTYMNVSRYDLGMGVGVRKFRILLLFNEREALEDFLRGGWDTAMGAETAGGSEGAVAATASKMDQFDVSVHFLTDSGAHLAASLRLLKVSMNYDLTHTGVSDISIPNINFTTTDKAPPDAPRQWDRALPFMAQKVIDKGYDLPMPYGIGVTYANVDQEQLLDKLEIGFGGSEKVPVELVSFSDASSKSESGTLKLDTWLFPFMKVFALLGKVDGKAPLTVNVPWHDFLDCGAPTPPPSNPLCSVLPVQSDLHIEANFNGNTYGAGTVLAGGWSNYFVTIPLTITYADMEGNDTEGLIYTASPRFGYVFQMGNAGVLAPYIGASYLVSDLTVTGTEIIPGTNIAVDYKIEQSNKDTWAGVIGANYDISKRWSIQAEYNGFTGSRDSFIASVGYRF